MSNFAPNKSANICLDNYLQKLHQSEAAAVAAAAAAVAVTAAVAAAEASHFNCKTKLQSLPRQLLVTVCQ